MFPASVDILVFPDPRSVIITEYIPHEVITVINMDINVVGGKKIKLISLQVKYCNLSNLKKIDGDIL